MQKKRTHLWRKTRNLEEIQGPEAVEQPLGVPHHEWVHVLAYVCYLCFRICIYRTAGLG